MKKKKIIIYLFLLMQFVQIIHMLYFGIPIHPKQIKIIFSEYQDIFLAMQDIPYFIFLIGGSFFILLILLHKKIMKFKTNYIPFFSLLIFILPLKIYLSGTHLFCINFKHSTIHSAINTFFSALFWKDKKIKQSFKDYTVSFFPPKHKRILIIMGESMNPDYSFSKELTPFLYNLKPYWRKGYSSDITTLGSIELFFNLNPFDAQQKYNLFRLAKKQEYYISLHSAQENGLFALAGIQFCDESINDHEMKLKISKKTDEYLIDLFSKLKWKPMHLHVLHLRHAHTPYSAYCDQKIEGKTRHEKTINAYKQVMRYHDHFLEKIFKHLPNDVQVIFVSDHGELLGPKHYAHSFEDKSTHTIPVWSYPEKPLPYTHLEISKEIAKWMGVQITEKK